MNEFDSKVLEVRQTKKNLSLLFWDQILRQSGSCCLGFVASVMQVLFLHSMSFAVLINHLRVYSDEVKHAQGYHARDCKFYVSQILNCSTRVDWDHNSVLRVNYG